MPCRSQQSNRPSPSVSSRGTVPSAHRGSTAALTTEAVLLPGCGSPTSGLTCAVLTIMPATVGATTTLIRARAKAGTLGAVHVTTPALWTQVTAGVVTVLTNLTPAGSLSLTVTLVAAAGPLLVTS